MLVIQCRLSNISCLRPICLSSACRFLSRLSVLMTRLRASTTSLRSSAKGPASEPASLEGTTFKGRGGVISSLICIPVSSGARGFVLCPRSERSAGAEPSHGPIFLACEGGHVGARVVVRRRKERLLVCPYC